MSTSRKEIFGFFRDSETGRYYRRTNDFENRLLISKIEYHNREEDTLKKYRSIGTLTNNLKKPDNPNVMKIISLQETGSTLNVKYKNELMKIKTRQMRRTSDPVILGPKWECGFLRYGKNNLISVWDDEECAMNSQFNRMICDVSFQMRDKRLSTDSQGPTEDPTLVPLLDKFHLDQLSGAVSDLTTTADISYISHENLGLYVYIGNRLNNSSFASVFAQDPRIRSMIKNYEMKRTVYSCSAFYNNVIKFAVGSEKCCYISDGIQSKLYERQIPGLVYSIEYEENGNLIYCGLHTGELATLDLRTSSPVNKKNIGIGSIVDTYLFKNNCQSIILSGLRTLSLVDLRKQQCVFTYKGHLTTPRKTPFCVREDLNLLCATSRADTVTRLWSLNRGELLHSIRPPPRQESAFSGIICKGARWFVTIVIDNELHIYEPKI